MIVTPDKGIFFVATALMCSASLYGAELSATSDPMTRVFVGQPNLLTFPPGFPSDVDTSGTAGCGAEPAEPELAAVAVVTVAADKVASKTDEVGCGEPGPKSTAEPTPLRGPLDVANAKADLPLQPISAGSAAQVH